MSKQILRSGTSIGANIEEANQTQSKADFIHKLSIALKESFETHYWLRLLRDSEILEDKIANSLLTDCEEVQKILTSSIKTSKKVESGKLKVESGKWKIKTKHYQLSTIN